VETLCSELSIQWRNRKLDPYHLLHLFILQVLHNNTAMTHLPHLSAEQFTPAAYCRARRRLPLDLFKRLIARVGRQCIEQDETPRRATRLIA
jgi:hypothetical protein